jgi:copper chaperone NosL
VDFARQGSFVAVEQAFFLQSEAIKSPMRADVAAFSDKQALEKTKADIPDGKEMDWNTLKASL